MYDIIMTILAVFISFFLFFICVISPIIDSIPKKESKTEKENRSLQSSILNYEKQLSTLKKELSQKQNRINSQQLIIDNYELTLESLNSQIEKHIKENSELRSQLNYMAIQAQEVHQTILKEVETEKREQTEALQNQVLQLKNDLSKAILENETLKREESDLKNTIYKGAKTVIQKENNIQAFFKGIEKGRLENAFKSDLELQHISVSADIRSDDHVHKNVTLTHCTCKDSSEKHFTCKHMQFLAYTLGVLQLNKEIIRNQTNYSIENLSKKRQELIDLEKQRKKEQEKIKNAKNKLKKMEEQAKAEADKTLSEADKLKKYYTEAINQFDEIIKKKCDAYPQLAVMMADLLTQHYEESAVLLVQKKNPALHEAKRIRELREETKQILTEKKELEYRINYIQSIIPNINDIFDMEAIDDSLPSTNYSPPL